MAAVVIVDEHNTIQRGPLIGNVDRTEDELLLTMPEWLDQEGGKDPPVIPVDITQKVPLPLRDDDGRDIRLWIVRDKGHLDAVSGSTLVSEKIPKRWDLPLVDPRRIFRHLEGAKPISSITSALTTKTGIITIIGILMLGGFATVTILTATGHIK